MQFYSLHKIISFCIIPTFHTCLVSQCQYDAQDCNLRKLKELVQTLSLYKYLFVNVSFLSKLLVYVYIHSICSTLFSFKLFFTLFMHILPLCPYVFKENNCVLMVFSCIKNQNLVMRVGAQKCFWEESVKSFESSLKKITLEK